MAMPASNPTTQTIQTSLRKAARDDFGAFCVYVLDFDVADFHKDWIRALIDYDRACIISARCHGKSSLVSFAYTLWRVGRDVNIRVKLVTQNDDKAKDLLFQISTALQSPRYQEVFPEIRPAKGRFWTKSKIFVERDKILRDATVEAAGINTSVLGGRADLLIGDDVCFDDKTEVLTDQGFFLFKDLPKDAKVATLGSNDVVSYQEPLRYIDKQYKGIMYEYQGKSLDFCVTAGHEMYTRGMSKGEYKKMPIEQLADKHTCYMRKTLGTVFGQLLSHIQLPEYNHTWQKGRSYHKPLKNLNASKLLSLIGFFLAEGHLLYNNPSSGKRPSSTVFTQKQGETQEALCTLLTELGYAYKLRESARWPDVMSTTVHDVQLATFFTQFGTNCYDKHIPRWVHRLDSSLLSYLLDWYIEGDGNVSKKGETKAWTASKALSDDIAEVGLKCGVATKVTKTFPKAQGFNNNPSTIYRIHFSKVVDATCISKKLKSYDYVGNVYCVTVPNGLLYVRRNGKGIWAGNCDNRNIATAGLRKTVKDAWYNVWLNLLEPANSQVVYVGTKWHNDDLCSELQKNQEYKQIFQVIDEDFTPLWPKYWSKERLLEAYRTRGSYAFNRGFRNLPATDSDFDFPPSIIESCIDPNWVLGDDLDSMLGVTPVDSVTTIKIANDVPLRKYTGVDLAISKSTGAAYTVIFTMGVTTDDVRLPIEIKRARMNSPETARAILDTYQRHKPEIVMVESNTYQRAVIEWLQDLVKLPIKGYYTGAQKTVDARIGVKSLAVELENRMWRIPRILHTGDCTCGFCSWLNELRSYPHGTYDDCVMAMWLCREGYRSLQENTSGGFSVWQF